ncbi:MAG: class I SAM-dependent methyltransferase [Nanoarchaeota archaeon]|nr:class I SAM-dependent methyltransferase [Nanoarchaeota archaeon]
MKNKIRAFDILGSVALVKFPAGTPKKDRKKFALNLLKEQKQIKTILEKTGRFKGRLRKMKTAFLAGENTKEVLYKENGCIFRFNIDKTYFSPRLAGERKEISSKIKAGDEVLVMFAGVGPFSVAIAKNSKAKKVYSNELNRDANKYGKLNIELNKLKGKIELLPGDIKRVAEKLKKHGKKFDVIVMPRPQLKDSFLKQAFNLSKKGTRIYYYDFAKNFPKKNFGATKSWAASSRRQQKDFIGCKTESTEAIVNKIKTEAKTAKKKIKILKIKEAGEIAPYKIRIRIDFVIS